jgi:hypothetical protein
MFGIATRLPAEQSGVRIPVEAKYLNLLQKSTPALGPPNSLLFKGYCGSFTGVRRPGREVDHSPSTATVGNNVRYSDWVSLLGEFTAGLRSVNSKRLRTTVL